MLEGSHVHALVTPLSRPWSRLGHASVTPQSHLGHTSVTANIESGTADPSSLPGLNISSQHQQCTDFTTHKISHDHLGTAIFGSNPETLLTINFKSGVAESDELTGCRK